MERTRIRGASTWVAAVVVVVSIGAGLRASAESANVSFGGYFEATILSTQTAPVTVDGVSVSAVAGIGGVSALLNATFSDTSFDALSLSASGAIGPFALGSSLAFNPSTLAFLSWQTTASLSMFDVQISDVLYVGPPQTQSYNQFTLSGTAGAVALRASARFGICPTQFWEASACADWTWAECGPEIDACLQIADATGFSAFDVTMTELVLLEDFHGIRGTLDLAISFAIDEKTVSPTLRVQSDWPICTDIDLLGELSTGTPTGIEGLLLYGIRGEAPVGEGTTLRFAESFAEEKDATVTGKSGYFERFGVTGTLPSCCGSPGSIELDAYFERTSTGLLGLGLMTSAIDVQITSAFALSLEAEYPATGTGWEITSRFRVVW